MAWKGESRRHSLARKGVKTANGHMRKPTAMRDMEFANRYEIKPKLFVDRGAIDGEAFAWMDFGHEDPMDSVYAVVTDGDDYVVMDDRGNELFRSSNLNESISKMKEIMINRYEIDLINSPMGEMLGWVKEGELTGVGRDLRDEYKYVLMASGNRSRKEMEKYLWHLWNDMNPKATNEEVREYKKFIANKTDDQLQESYDRQKSIMQPLTPREMREQDAGVRSLFSDGSKAKKMKYSVVGMFDGFRIDHAVVEARSMKEAKEKFRKMYKQPRKVTGVRIESVFD